MKTVVHLGVCKGWFPLATEAVEVESEAESQEIYDLVKTNTT